MDESPRLEFCAMDDAIEISDLHFSYGDLEIFRGLSLRIARGKVVAILGASGSGKSTLLKIIGGQLSPSQGAVKVAGENVHQLSSEDLYRLRLEIGMMFQNAGLFTDASVFDNVAFPIRENFDLPEELVRRIVLLKLNAVGLRGARDLRANDLSGGMTRRVALARAIATDPNLMMYDEPFAGLDPISLNHICHLIRDLNEALGLTSVVVTYNVKQALAVADYAYVIADGAAIRERTADGIKQSARGESQTILEPVPRRSARVRVLS